MRDNAVSLNLFVKSLAFKTKVAASVIQVTKYRIRCVYFI